jgi:hypothetical protein
MALLPLQVMAAACLAAVKQHQLAPLPSLLLLLQLLLFCVAPCDQLLLVTILAAPVAASAGPGAAPD